MPRILSCGIIKFNQYPVLFFCRYDFEIGNSLAAVFHYTPYDINKIGDKPLNGFPFK